MPGKKEWGWRKTREAGLEPGGAASMKVECMAKFVALYHQWCSPFWTFIINLRREWVKMLRLTKISGQYIWKILGNLSSLFPQDLFGIL
jgi:hypothetical protein